MSNYNDFEILGFDTPDVDSGSHYEKTNDIIEDEIIQYQVSEATTTKFNMKLNLFSLEYRVVLDKTKSKRYQYAIGLKNDSVAKVSAILNKDYVNIAYWDTYPNVFKNVPVSHLVLYENSPIKHKIKVFFTKLIRKILFIE